MRDDTEQGTLAEPGVPVPSFGSRADVAMAAALVVLSAAVYVATAAPSVATVFDDSLEFQVVLPTLGIAHPSGYPLYTLVGYLFTRVPWGSMAFRANTLSGVFGAVAVGLLFAVCREAGCRRPAAIVAALALACSPVWWSQATIAEVYTLHVCLALLTVWLSLRVADGGPREVTYRRARWLALAFGVGLTHHRMTALLAPMVALALWMALGRGAGLRRWLRLTLPVAAPLLLYAYIPLRGLSISSLDGTYTNTVAGFVAHVSAAGYGAFLEGNPLGAHTWSVVDYLALFRQQFGYVGLALMTLGLIVAMRRSAKALLLAVALVCNLGFALAYRVPDVEVFFLPAFAILCVYGGLGLEWLAGVPARPGRGRVSAAVAGAMPVVVAVVLAWPVPQRWLEQDRSAAWSVADQGVAWLRAVEEGGVVVGLLGETTLMRYFQRTEGLRPDVELVVADGEEQRLAAVRALVAAGRPTYVTRSLAGLADEFDLDAAGPLVRVSPRGSDGPVVQAGQPALAGLSVSPWQVRVEERHGRAQVTVSLAWLVTAPPDEDLKVSARASRAGIELARVDTYPVHDTYRSGYWADAGEPVEAVEDYYELPMPVGDAGGTVDVTLVLYDAGSGAERVRLDLGSVTVPRSPGRRPLDEWGASAGLAYSTAGAQLLAAGPRGSLSARAGDSLTVDTLWRVAASGAGGGWSAQLVSGGRECGRVELATDVAGVATGDMLRLTGELVVPARLETGTYELVLTRSGPATLFLSPSWPVVATERRLATVRVTGREHVFAAPQPQQPVSVTFAGAGGPTAALVGYDLATEGSQLQVTLYWQALAEPQGRYKVFVHCLDATGTVVAQSDGEPAGNTAPTDSWLVGEYVADGHTIDLGDAAGQPLRIYVGLYREGEERLQPAGGEAADGALLLAEIGG